MSRLDVVYQRAPHWAQTLMLNAYAARLFAYRRGRAFRASVARLAESERWPAERLAKYQDEQVRRIIAHAYAKSPYYREVLAGLGLSPADVRGTRDLARLPLITKETIREHGERMLAAPRPLRSWRHGHTSGTTGSPLSLWYDRGTAVMNEAVDWRQKQWGGMRDRDWIGVLLGRVIVPTEQKRPPFWRVNHVLRQIWFSSFHLTDEHLSLYVEEMRRRGLRFLEGYPSTVFILAQYLVRHGERLPLQAVFTSSETLHRVQRETIELAFGCRPFDFYGHAERVIFATECEHHDGKHLAEEYGYTEVVDDAGNAVPDGTPGWLVGTSLHNTALPMIRYRTGDMSAIRREPCACGRTLARIESVTTKAEDIVVTPDGRLVSPSVLTHPFKPFPQIVKSQLVQDRVDHLLVKIVPSTAFTSEHQTVLLSELAKRLGSGIELEVRIVEDIAREPSGKYRWVVSRVQHPSHFTWGGGDS